MIVQDYTIVRGTRFILPVPTDAVMEVFVTQNGLPLLKVREVAGVVHLGPELTSMLRLSNGDYYVYNADRMLIQRGMLKFQGDLYVPPVTGNPVTGKYEFVGPGPFVLGTLMYNHILVYVNGVLTDDYTLANGVLTIDGQLTSDDEVVVVTL